jgi:hypothetical protein
MSKRDAVKATTLGNWAALADRYRAIGQALRVDAEATHND